MRYQEEGYRYQSPLYPVVVWIHGGSFQEGSGLSHGFNPRAFVEKDIIVVSFNYRLNVYGFSPEASNHANVGLNDQLVALKWVAANIQQFGGDPKRVTTMGWGSGAASVNYLMYNKEAEGLFHSAIAMSGSFLSPWSFINDPMSGVRNMCRSNGIRNCHLDQMIIPLINYKPKPNDKLTLSYLLTGQLGLFRPRPEFYGDSPWNRINNGKFNDVPLLMGVANQEHPNYALSELPRVVQLVAYEFPNNDTKAVRRIYDLLRKMQIESPKTYSKTIRYGLDHYPILKFLNLHSSCARDNVFHYVLQQDENFNGHGGSVGYHDVQLLFRNYNHSRPIERQIGQQLEKVWTEFILNR